MRFSFERWNLIRANELGLKFDDLAIITYFVDFSTSGKMDSIIHQGKVYYWIFYDNIVKEYPMLTIKSRDGVYRRFKKYVDVGLLHTVLEPGTQRPHYCLDPDMYFSLLSYTSQMNLQSEKSMSDESENKGKDERVGFFSEGVGNNSEHSSEENPNEARKNFRTDSTTIQDPITIDPYCIVTLAQNEKLYQHWWGKYCEGIPDNAQYRAASHRKLVEFVTKYKPSVDQLIYALKESVDKGHAGHDYYLAGILNNINLNRYIDADVPVELQVENLVKKRLTDMDEYLRHYEFDHKNMKVLYSLTGIDDAYIRRIFNGIEEDLTRQCQIDYQFIDKSFLRKTG